MPALRFASHAVQAACDAVLIDDDAGLVAAFNHAQALAVAPRPKSEQESKNVQQALDCAPEKRLASGFFARAGGLTPGAPLVAEPKSPSSSPP